VSLYASRLLLSLVSSCASQGASHACFGRTGETPPRPRPAPLGGGEAREEPRAPGDGPAGAAEGELPAWPIARLWDGGAAPAPLVCKPWRPPPPLAGPRGGAYINSSRRDPPQRRRGRGADEP